jgi:hypothetical protein
MCSNPTWSKNVSPQLFCGYNFCIDRGVAIDRYTIQWLLQISSSESILNPNMPENLVHKHWKGLSSLFPTKFCGLFPSKLIWNYGPCWQSIGLLGRGISPSVRPLATRNMNTERRKETYIYISSGIPTLVPSVWQREDISCVRQRGHFDWQEQNELKWTSLCRAAKGKMTCIKGWMGGEILENGCM